eukprot:scaffold8184_cov111-Cylindrotheca_fusiformis.AAC.1
MGYHPNKGFRFAKQAEKRQRLAEERQRQLSYLRLLRETGPAEPAEDNEAQQPPPGPPSYVEIDEPFDNLQDDDYSSTCSGGAQEQDSPRTRSEVESEHANLLVQSLFGNDQGADDADSSTGSGLEQEEGEDEVLGDSDDTPSDAGENGNNNNSTLYVHNQRHEEQEPLAHERTSHFTGFKHRITIEEEGSYDLITLLDSFGAPRNAYDRLLALLRKQKKKGFDVGKQAIGRDVFLKRMQKKFGCPKVQTNTISDCTVFSFPFTEMLQDLVDCRQRDIHHFDPEAPSYTAADLMNTNWASETYRQLEIDRNKECLLPLVLYMDKT